MYRFSEIEFTVEHFQHVLIFDSTPCFALANVIEKCSFVDMTWHFSSTMSFSDVFLGFRLSEWQVLLECWCLCAPCQTSFSFLCCIMLLPHGVQEHSVRPAHHVSHDQEFIAFHLLGLPISAATIYLCGPRYGNKLNLGVFQGSFASDIYFVPNYKSLIFSLPSMLLMEYSGY